MRSIYLLFLFVTLIILENSTLSVVRVQCYVHLPYYSLWRGLLGLAPNLRKYGLIFVREKPDVILCNGLTPELAATDTPIIILEKRDAASLWINSRPVLMHDQVKAIFKNYVFRFSMFNNKPICAGTYHLGLVNNYARLYSLNTPYYLTPTILNKIHLVIWNFHGSAFSPKKAFLKDYTIDFAKFRPIDIFFAGEVSMPKATAQSNTLYGWHRGKAIAAIRSLKNVQKIALSGKVLPYQQYVETIKNSKIVVSPWGFGEWCHRDYEAIHCGAVLIKPDTSFVQAIPDIYQNNSTYVPCKPDFSDLQQKVDHILTHYESYQPMRERAKKLLVDSWDMDALAYNFALHVHQALGIPFNYK